MTKVEEFRGQTVDQLSDQLVKLKKEQFNLRFQRASGQLENTARVRVVRHDIARILTVLNQRGETASVPLPAGAAKQVKEAKEAKPKKAKEEKKAAAPKEEKPKEEKKASAKSAPAKTDKKAPAKKSPAKKK